jgi:hypothetical protein
MPLDMSRRVGAHHFSRYCQLRFTSATYDLANRLTRQTVAGVTASLTWEMSGRLTSDGVRSYSWDARNRLTAINEVASFGYDGSIGPFVRPRYRPKELSPALT